MKNQTFPSDAAIQEIIASTEKKEARAFAAAFRARQAAEPNIEWALLAQIFDFRFDPKNPAEPFGPMVIADGKRSMIPGDLADDQLDSIESTLGSIDDPEYVARICDVLWLRRRKADLARHAVEAYTASGQRLEDPKHWVHGMNRYERAARLARQIEPKGDLPKAVLTHLELRVRHYNGSDPLYFTLKALELLEELRFGDFAILAEIAGRVAKNARETGDFRRARSHYDVQARLLRRFGKHKGAEAALVDQAECFVEEAKAREKEGSFIAAHTFWQEGIKAFRERPSLRPKIPELQACLAAAGKRTIDEMTSVEGEIDISTEVAEARKQFTDLPLDDAFFTFVTFVDPVDPEKLRDEALEGIRENPLQALVQANIFDEAGRKIAVRPSVGIGGEPEEVAIEGFMDQNARLERGLVVHAALAPAMRAILAQHFIDESTIKKLIEDSAFIPDGRLPLFVKAIAEGFRWDFSTALHILVPQAENSLRHILEQQGVIPRTVDHNGVETVWSCERVLDHDKMSEVLGKSLVYELRSLLAGRLGPNLRNLIAHGLASHSTLNGEISFYLWWILVRITAMLTSGMQAFSERRRAATT